MEMDFMEQQEQFLSRWLLTFIAIILFGCNNKQEFYTANIPPVYIQSNSSSLHHKEGVLYYYGKPYSGYTIETFINGDTARITPYINGKEEGWAKAFYADKQIAEERFYVHGKKEGIHKGWWQNGKPKFEYHFLNDEHEGELKEWFTNGMLARDFHYSKGYETGAQKMWWENGDIRANYVVKNGERYGLIGQKLCRNILNDSL
jgi:antitoxin component YwqK of YwqJK toxin-antitoxin module